MKLIVAVLIIVIVAAAASTTTAIALSSRDEKAPEQPYIERFSTLTPIEKAISDYDRRRQLEEAEREHWRQQLSFD